ncbi:MAG TPA: sulfatase-like hydrolase/transferase [Bryobacteraceae bacterium]|nr:sulfatase-like hydrolase/transferase [Bryobacteraceae bacterium]
MPTNLNRRQFLQTAGAGALGAAVKQTRPNILFINVDQLNATAISGVGCKHVATPNIDRLMKQGVSFHNSYCANPVCCPSRSGWFSGRPSSETGAPGSILMRPEIPDLGQWLGARGYESFYAGKWHIKGHDVAESFHYLTPGTGMGENGDGSVSRAAEGFLRSRNASKPFFLTLGFLQPHDICYWIMRHYRDIGELPCPEIAGELPPLPPNYHFDRREPRQILAGARAGGAAHKFAEHWSELHWRYYLWSYYRHAEMVDAEVGRVLDALEDSSFAKNTVVIFASDHGEGMANHRMVIKGYLYDSAARVPLVISWPGELPERVRDEKHLASGFDLAPTICDFAGVETMPKSRGFSLKPLLEGRGAPQRDFIAAEAAGHGLMIRTAEYKHISYPNDSVCQLFDMKNDPWETRNVAGESKYAKALAGMEKRKAEWESRLEKYPGAPVSNNDQDGGSDEPQDRKTSRRARKNGGAVVRR